MESFEGLWRRREVLTDAAGLPFWAGENIVNRRVIVERRLSLATHRVQAMVPHHLAFKGYVKM